jgi:cyanophycin synthetase
MSANPPTEPGAASAGGGAPPAAATASPPGTRPPPAADAAPCRAFEDSRRLTGPARDHAGPAVTLTPLGRARHDPQAHLGWAHRVRALAARLGWPDPQPIVRPDADDPALIFAAPAGCLFTATELNEWAWERSAAAVDAALFGPGGFEAAQPATDDEATASAHFAAMAQAEWRPDLAALRSATAGHGLPWLEDDEQASIGSGEGARVWTHTRPAPPLASSPAGTTAGAPAPAPEPAPLRIPLPMPDAVPWATLRAVPTALVTGSNGKTTTVRLLAAMAQTAGWVAGANTTEGVVVGGRVAAEGDYAGPAGARAVLRHPAVQCAVLETARGGLLRRGLALDRAEVAVVTGIAADHFGEYGIRTLADLAEVKLIVARALVPPGGDATRPPGCLVLNADDPVLMATAERLPHARVARRALFAAVLSHPALQACADAGGAICGVHQGRLLLVVPGEPAHDLGEPADLPLTLGGAAQHNLANACAAALAAHALGLPARAIAATLARFGTDPDDNPGRLERWAWHGATVLVDYAHNPDGLGHLLTVARRLLRLSPQPGVLSLLLGQAGNRSDADIAALAQVAAGADPARVVIKELPAMWRGRVAGEVPALLLATLRAAGLPAARIALEADEQAAALRLLEAAGPGDVVVLPVHTTAARRALATVLKRG